MKVTTLDTPVAEQIGHAFGYYDYGEEVGMGAFYRSKDAVATYIAGYVRMAFEGGMLYTISERGEGYIAYKVPGQKLKLRAGMQLVKALFRSMSLKELIRMGQGVSKGGTSLHDRMKKREETLYIRRHGLCAGTISGAGLHAEGDGACLRRRQPAAGSGASGDRCEVKMRQIHAPWHAA